MRTPVPAEVIFKPPFAVLPRVAANCTAACDVVSPTALLPGVVEMANEGHVTGASGRNWAGYGVEVLLDNTLPPVARDLLADPQTSGGLLVSCTPDRVKDVMAVFRAQGCDAAAPIGVVR